MTESFSKKKKTTKKSINLFYEFQCIERKLAVVSAKYLEEAEIHCPQPSIRITANRLFTDVDIDFIFDTIERVSNEMFSS